MIFLSIMGNSFGCSAAGERLVSAARDGDLPEARALLEYNPRLARYSTFGVRNSPLHYSAAQGHHEIVSLLLECGVEINQRNYRGQTALMQACLYGHWEAVQTLVLFRANIHRKDYLNGGTALHFAALNGHSRCIRLLLSDYVPSMADFWNIMRKLAVGRRSGIKSDASSLNGILNKPADGGITALHMAALNGHAETVQLLLDLGACFTKVTVDDGTTIDLIGAGSTPLHYAACGGNMQCCQILISRGASLIARNANGMTPLMIARSWHRNCLEGILSKQPEGRPRALPSPYLSLPLMSIVKIARECGWTDKYPNPAFVDPCAICLERKCTVAAGGCKHEFCTICALYLCSTNSSSTSSPPGSIACPLCRHGIVTFVKLPGTSPIKETAQVTSSLSSSTECPNESPEAASESMPFCRSELSCTQISPLVSASLGALGLHRLPSMRLNSSLCMRAPDSRPSLTSHEGSSRITNSVSSSCSRTSFQRSVSHNERTSCFSFNQCVATSSG